MKRVGFGPRLLAMILDVIIVMIVMGIVGAITGQGFNQQDFSKMFEGGAKPINVPQIIVMLLYTSMEFLLAATPGKMILKLKIKGASGKNGAMPVLLTRWIIKQSSSILSFLFILTHIQVLWYLQSLAGLIIFVGCFFTLGKNKQAIHDMLAKTAVYKGK